MDRARAAAGSLVVVAAIGCAAAYWQNNRPPAGRAEFTRRFDEAIRRADAWLAAQSSESNAALVFMIDDMARLTSRDDLKRLVDVYRTLPELPPQSPWRRLAYGEKEVGSLPQSQRERLEDYQRFIMYAVAGAENPLSPDDEAAMFAPYRWHWGSLTHQLYSLEVYRRNGGAQWRPGLDALIEGLCGRIAREAVWDFRVTDLYIQRAAFLAGAGCGSIVKPRWVERILDKQEGDGGWTHSWHGWGSRILSFNRNRERSDSHATVQAMWLLYQLKYRYAGWIDRAYPASP